MSLGVLLLVSACSAAPPEEAPSSSRQMSRVALEDKIRGGWAGQMIGVAYGAPTEFTSNGKIIEGDIAWSPDMVENAIHQDDLYVEMTFAEVMDSVGLDATTEQYGDMFRASEYTLWHANASARRNLNRGIQAPMSGDPRFNVHANDIDFQIESDFIGLMTPGLPRESNRYADRVGHVMAYGDGLYGGMFFAGMYAAAFFATDPRRVVEQGLVSIPAGSGYANVIRDVLAWHLEDPADWRRTWQRVEDKWNRDDMCPYGVGNPFNIDARLNGAYVALGLLYGDGDFGKTMEIATRSGQDSDCNPSSAAGILGVMLGYDGIPDPFKSGIAPIADTRFDFTRHSFNSIVQSTLARAEAVIRRAGGEVTATGVVIPVQAPEAPPLEQWDAGVPIARVGVDDDAWRWQGGWTRTLRTEVWERPARQSTAVGNEASLDFEGTGVAIAGELARDGGRADVWLDGVLVGEIEAWIAERTYDNDLWHVTDLPPGKHTIRVVTRADADPNSKGKKIEIEHAVIYDRR